MRSITKFFLVFIWFAILATPIAIFISIYGADSFSSAARIFPLLGLIAFTLIWSQIMVGALIGLLSNYFPGILRWHIWQGTLALLFVLLHPTLRILTLPYEQQINYFMFRVDFVDPGLAIYVTLGTIALMFLVLGVLAGFLRRWPPLKKYWRWIHWCNYIVFILAFIHSINIGSIFYQSTIMKTLWYGMFITGVLALVYRRVYLPYRTYSKRKEAY